jgi:hypothetical protein
MKINEVTEAGMETTPTQKKLANIGRALMTHSETASMKGADDAKIGMFNQMSSLGNELTKFGTTFGPKDLQGLMKATGLNAATIKTLLAFGEKLAAKGVAPKVADLDPEDEPQDDFGGPSDDEIDAQARQAAMGK